MKKSSTLQIAAPVAIYILISIWAATKHLNTVSDVLTSINSFLVILALSLAFPYFCFKILSKLYTPPVLRNSDDASKPNYSEFEADNLQEIADPSETMQYRGSRYSAEDLSAKSINHNSDQAQIKYRGTVIESGSASIDKSSEEGSDSLLIEKKSQKSVKSEKKVKYRGSYLD